MNAADILTSLEKINLLKWHLDRYDRLRQSTASRASAVLSATAILSAGNALVFSQLIGRAHTVLVLMPDWLLITFTIALICSTILIVLCLILSSRVLVTSRNSRKMLESDGEFPVGLVFNGTDTVSRISCFKDFQETVKSQGHREILEAAQVELWITIQQHRYRYSQLRVATRLLRWASFAFLVVLIGAMIANLAINP